MSNYRIQILHKINSHFIRLFFLAILITQTNPIQANQRGRNAVIRGTITTTKGEPLEFATVYLKGTSMGVNTDEKGEYMLRAVPGSYTLCAQLMGYEVHEQAVEIEPNARIEANIRLKDDQLMLGDVEVVAESVVQQINKTAYNVVAVDAKALHNTSLDLAKALDRISGIKIKEVGGVGSDAQITLNGFSGRHVKVFMDGVPLEGAGSSMQINNIPVNLAERIEVYKGVVPVELGADALGGAINIVTRNTSNTFVDASYTIGSFNTHKSNLSVGHTTKNGYTFQINAYQNYSDNNYKVKTQLLDLESNRYSAEEYWFKRFHDNYHNEAVIAKVGVRDKIWATRLLLEMTYSQEKADVQHANLMKIVYGGKDRRAKTLAPSLNYEKKNLLVDNLNFSLNARYNKVRSNSTDTLARQYNWNGDWVEKSTKGEGTYSLSESDNKNGYITGNLNYRINESHYIAVNNVFNKFSRQSTDAVANSDNVTDATFMKRTSMKNVLGVSYKFDYGTRWNASAFLKQYNVNVTGPVNVSTTNTASYEEQSRTFSTMGYGLATSYLVIPSVRLKASYEKAYRLPTERELFGDEVLETGDATLKPENSQNININITYDQTFNKVHSLYLDAGFVYRDTRDYIRRQIEASKGGAYYTNHGQVRNLGFDVEARYFYNRKFSIGGNLTYQEIVNLEQYDIYGLELVYYKDRMPNQPYFFSNADASYNFFDLWGKDDVLTVGYNLQYTHRFYRAWKSEGGDIHVPTQLSHDINLNYSVKNGRYNIGLEAKNILDEIMYDNYSLQKPGRSFYLKFRYYFFRSK